ncbi:PEGA domain-containing protein [Patescibacteria group bacterium]|nr:PEGA domain-containing protein [Patescibacteria group bacterium]
MNSKKLPKKPGFKKLGYMETLLTLIILGGITTILYLYTSGYRLNKDENGILDVEKTGMIGVKSVPDRASVYLDGKLVTATDDTISGVTPGKHTIKIVKKGFLEWTKEIEVFEQLVTDITAILISQSTRLDPLTITGARYPSISPSLSKLAYFSFDEEKPGVWVIPLTGINLGLLRLNPSIAIQDTRYTNYSDGEEIIWSPDEKNLLVRSSNETYYLINLDNNSAQTTLKWEEILTEWEEDIRKKREDFISNSVFIVPEEIINIGLSEEALWAPDEKKFLFKKQNGNQIEYWVYNFEVPIPVGEKTESLVFTTDANSPQPKITWYTDSFHLILVEGDIENEKRGTISMIRIDGSNKTEVYNNTLYSDLAFSAPGGDKIIIVTSFKSEGQTDLYTVSIR